MTDPRRRLGAFAVFALVLLRLATGWHFFHEGSQKVEYDKGEGKFHLVFSSEGFLSQAKGPLAGFFLNQVPNDHDWATHLAVPQRNEPLSDEALAEREKWDADYARRRADAVKNGEPIQAEFPPYSPYVGWAEQIAADWKKTLADATAVSGVADEQQGQMADAYVARKEQLAEYLKFEMGPMVEYQHELWRLENWRDAPEADGLPFQGERIASKAAQTGGSANAWIREVRGIERGFHDDLRATLTPEQKSNAETIAALDDALTSPRQETLNMINIAVTAMTIGVGICLLLGFFTRLAAIVGALFLLSVVATQPPWVTGAAPIHYQCVELTGLLVLAGTGAGRWAGLDYFLFALFNRNRDNTAAKRVS